MFQFEKQNKAISAAIKYGMEMYGFDHEQMALYIHRDRVTFFRRMKHPENFTVEELRCISAKIHIPIEKLVKGEIQ